MLRQRKASYDNPHTTHQNRREEEISEKIPSSVKLDGKEKICYTTHKKQKYIKIHL